MYLQFKGKRLGSILGDLRSVIEKRSSMPALSNVLIESVTAGKVRLTATDIDHTLQIEADHEGLFEGKCCLALDRLLGLAKALPEDDLTITPQESHWAEIKSDTGKYRVMGIDPDSYPVIPTGEAQSYELKGEDLLLALSQVSLHSNNPVKPEWCGVQIELNGGLRAVATTGSSIGICEVKVDQPFLAGTAAWFIPAKGVAALKTVFRSSATVLCWATDYCLFFRADGKLLISRRLASKFPAYERALQGLPTEAVTFDREGLTRALDVLTGFAPMESGTCTNYKAGLFSFGPAGLAVTAKSFDGEEATEEVDGRAGEEFEHRIDMHLLRPALKNSAEGAQLLTEKGKLVLLVSETGRAKTSHIITTLNR